MSIPRRDLASLLLLGVAVSVGATVVADREGHAPYFPEPVPGQADVVTRAPLPTHDIALTIDDGYDPVVVDAYLRFAAETGYPLTFNPVGVLAKRTWNARASTIRDLVERGQVQISNHTFHHRDLRALSSDKVITEIESNDDWIQKAFGVTSRPYLRPPLGAHDERVDQISGSLGYTKILLWQGSFSDAVPTTAKQVLHAAQQALLPGAIVVGHANQPAVTGLYEQITAIIKERNLQPRTLDHLFGTSRARGT